MSKKPDGYSSVIKPPLDNAVAALNASVAFDPVFPATRSLGDITKDTPDTCPPIAPDATPTLAKSWDVETRMPVDDPAVGAPILHPVRVTPYDTPPVTVAPLPSVNTTDDAPNWDALTLPAATTTPGVVLVSKKPDGYSRVIFADIESEEIVVKLMEQYTGIRPETRCSVAIKNETLLTLGSEEKIAHV